MRLTLRTMLAYLDDVLSEADAHELGQKIDSSDFATGLVHRIRNSISRLRLSSPDMLGSDSMDDPNTVAEFIDSSLSPEKEQEFEKVCLHSDTHLAEVASCHQILTMVLGTPARVEPRLRDRVYRTGIPSDGAVTPAPVGPDVRRESFRRVDMSAASVVSVSEPVEIKRPRRLDDSPASRAEFGTRKSLWPIAAAVLLGFLLTGGFMVAMGPLDSGHPLAGLLGFRDATVANNEQTDVGAVVESPDTAATTMLQTPPDFPTDAIAKQSVAIDSTLQLVDSSAMPRQGSTDGAWQIPDVAANGGGARDAESVAPENTTTATSDAWPDATTIADTTADLMEDTAALAGPPADVEAVPNVPVFDTPPFGGPQFGDSPSEGPSPDDLAADGPQFIQPEMPQASVDLPVEPNSDAVADAVLRDPFDRESIERTPRLGRDEALDANEPTILNEPPVPVQSIGLPGLAETPRALKSDGLIADANLGTIVEHADRTEPIAVDEDLSVDADGRNPAPPSEQLTEVGRFLSEGQVLTYWNEQASAWLRLPPRTAFGVGHRLRTLEVFRPQLLLAPSNIQVTLRGSSEIEFIEPADLQTPTLKVPYGRLMLNSTGRENARLTLRIAQRPVTIEFTEPDTEVVCHILPVLLPGLDPRQEPTHRIVQMFVTRGSAKMMEQDIEQQVELGNQYAFADDGVAHVTPFSEVPEWAHNGIGTLDRDAAVELETFLAMGRDTVLSLSESADSRRTDVRTLAVRSLVSLGYFRIAVSVFADPEHRHQWPVLYEDLRAAIAQGAESANAVHETFEQQYGAAGDKLYRMLVGFDNEQLKGGAADQLVDDLDHDELEFRALAFHNLYRLTGKTLTYVPNQSDKNRKRTVARWRNELKKGKLTEIVPPSEVAEWQRLSSPVLP